MAVTDPQPVYTTEDFRNSVKQLLPPGKYWQSDEESEDLTALIDSIAEELHTTHEETKLSVLFTVDNSLFGWKIADYQSLLNTNGIDALVWDDEVTPNVIYIKLFTTYNLLATFNQVEGYRLPHTIINWEFEVVLGMQAMIRPINYQRLELIEA
ncbi:MAG: hypothetical protein DSZ27_07330 [Thiomicrospira sp.]|nr:MAG: hypothetical protein DSZ27_07330 [Thiomicrospira sp.]